MSQPIEIELVIVPAASRDEYRQTAQLMIEHTAARLDMCSRDELIDHLARVNRETSFTRDDYCQLLAIILYEAARTRPPF